MKAPQAMHGPRRTAATAAATGQRRDPARDVRHLGEDQPPESKPQQTPNPLRLNDLRPTPLLAVYAGTVPAPPTFC